MAKSSPEQRLSSPLAIVSAYALFAWAYLIGSALLLNAWSGKPWAIENTFELAKGLLFVAITAAMLYGLLRRLFRSIDERTRQSEMNAALYRDLFDLIPEPAFVYDTGSFAMLAVNRAVEKQYGWTREELMKMTSLDFATPEDKPGLEKMVRERGAAETISGVFRHRNKHGHIFPVGFTSREMTFSGRRARLVVAWDISEVVEVREELQRLNESLEKRVAERTERLRKTLAELEWFGEAVSHDLKQPIAHLRSVATTLVQSAGDRLNPGEIEAAYRMVGASARLGNLIDELLQFARAEGGEATGYPVSMVLVVNEVLGQLRREFENHHVDVMVQEPLHWVRAHRPTLARVITGLLRIIFERQAAGAPACHVNVHTIPHGDRLQLVISCNSACLSDEERKLLCPADSTSVPQMPQGSGLTVLIRSVWRLGGELHCEKGPKGEDILVLGLPISDAAAAA